MAGPQICVLSHLYSTFVTPPQQPPSPESLCFNTVGVIAGAVQVRPHGKKENSSKIQTDVCFPAKEKTMNSFISPSPLLKHVYLQINIRNHLYTSFHNVTN